MAKVILSGGNLTVPGTLTIGNLAASNAAYLHAPTVVPVADRVMNFAGMNNSADGLANVLGMTFRSRHTMMANATGVQLVFQNWCTIGTPPIDTAGANPITVKGSVEIGGGAASGTLYPVTFNGQTSVIIPPGGDVVSDVVYIPMTKGQTFYTRSYVHVTDRAMTFLMGAVNDGTIYEGISNYAADSDTDATVSGDCSQDYAKAQFGPSAILSVSAGNTALAGVYYIGDSIPAGTGDLADASGPKGGFIDRALTTASIGRINAACSGTKANDITVGTWLMRAKLARFAPQAIIAWGINDAGASISLANYQTSMISGAAQLRAMGVSDVYACTITPQTSSTDAWATTANQTVGAHEALRLSYNAWLRTNPPQFTGIFDSAALVEVAGGKWYATGAANGGTTDGTHPSQAAHVKMAAAVTGQGLGQANIASGSNVSELTTLNNPYFTGTVNSNGGFIVPLAANDAGAALLGIQVGGQYAVTGTNVVMRRAS